MDRQQITRADDCHQRSSIPEKQRKKHLDKQKKGNGWEDLLPCYTRSGCVPYQYRPGSQNGRDRYGKLNLFARVSYAWSGLYDCIESPRWLIKHANKKIGRDRYRPLPCSIQISSRSAPCTVCTTRFIAHAGSAL